MQNHAVAMLFAIVRDMIRLLIYSDDNKFLYAIEYKLIGQQHRWCSIKILNYPRVHVIIVNCAKPTLANFNVVLSFNKGLNNPVSKKKKKKKKKKKEEEKKVVRLTAYAVPG